uniref:Uncharacterized protein n=1 Tax=Arundo donax TaxID=35708 RepID=A0A0A9ENL4_ARUDO
MLEPDPKLRLTAKQVLGMLLLVLKKAGSNMLLSFFHHGS